MFAGDVEGEYRVHSCFVNIRSRGLDEHYQIAGRREDVLRLEAEGLKLLKRKILIPNAMLLCKNINTFL
ncbi:3-phenylpropionate dioxygenase subunit beta [compost metagenome]